MIAGSYCHCILVFGLLSLGYSFAFQLQSFGGVASPLVPRCSFRPSFASPKSDDNDDSFTNVAWLQERFGLTEEWVGKKQIPGLHSMNQTIMIERLHWLQKRLKLNDEELGKMIRTFPNWLPCRPDTNLEPTIVFLEKKLGKKSVPKVVRVNPQTLKFSIQTLQRALKWFEKRLNVNTQKEMASIATKCPSLLTLSVEENLELTFNQLQERLGLNDTQLGRVLVRAPTLLAMNYTTGIEPKLDWLQERLDVDETRLRKMLVRYPCLPTYNIETTFEAKLEWLKESLQLDDEAAKKLVRNEPGVFQYSPSEKMEPMLQWLRENLDLEGPHDVAKVIVQQPSLFCTNTTTNLGPTLEFYKMCIGNEEALKMLQRFPFFFTYSLEKRLKPRLEQVQQKGIEVDAKWVRRMGRSTNHEWQAWLGKS